MHMIFLTITFNSNITDTAAHQIFSWKDRLELINAIANSCEDLTDCIETQKVAFTGKLSLQPIW